MEKPEDEENYGSKAVKAQLYLFLFIICYKIIKLTNLTTNFREYAKAGGGYVLLTFLLFTFLFNVGSNIFASYWLSKWMKDVHREVLVVNGESQSTSRVQYTRTLANSEDLGFYTSIYAFGLFVLLFSGVLKAVIFVKVCKIHIHNNPLLFNIDLPFIYNK